MKKVILALVILLMALPVFGQFRDTEWGMSRQEVMNIEGQPALNDGSLLGYESSLAGYPVYVYYQFTEGKLTSGWYYFNTSYASPTMYVRQYNDIKSKLLNVYGEPGWDGKKWYNNTYKGMDGMLGTAIQMGHVAVQCGWDKEKTRIIHTLTYDEGILHILKYRSQKYMELENQAQQKQSQQGL